MAKYINTDLLIRKIKGQIHLENLNFAALGGGGQTFCINTLEWVLKQINSLQQEQKEMDINGEIHKEAMKLHTAPTYDELARFAHHFYELGLNTRKED